MKVMENEAHVKDFSKNLIILELYLKKNYPKNIFQLLKKEYYT